jgi:hypothetical protein
MSEVRGSLPSLRSLYWRGYTIRRATTAVVTGVVLAAGIWWMLQPVPGALPHAEPPMEAVYGPWVALGGIALSILSGIVLARRYLLVKRILLEGDVIRGTVVSTNRYDTNSDSDSDTIRKSPTYVYYVTICYSNHGIDRKFQVRLPHSASTYGLRKGEDTDLLVLHGVSHQPLLRAVYLAREGI